MCNIIPICEIFGPTIQGEGPAVGLKCIFVRVAGCNFNCDFCDSKFSWKVTENTFKYTPQELSNELITLCSSTHTGTIVFTGGNPCLYDNLIEVINTLKEYNIQSHIETQGTPLPEWVCEANLVVISPKPPSSKQIDVFDNVKNFLDTYSKLTNLAIKIPVFNEIDFKYFKKFYTLLQDYPNVKLYLSIGNDNVTESGNISQRILNNYNYWVNEVINSNMKNVYVLPQIHTLIWGNKQGV